MKKILLLTVSALVLSGCTKQRDLYDISWPLLSIEGDWVPSLGIADMSGNATAVLYRDGVPAGKSFFLQPASTTARVSRGDHDILIFNGMMFSEEQTNLDYIVFRNTDNVDTFEAFSTEPSPNKRLVRAEGERLVNNEMPILASAHAKKTIEGKPVFFMKYENGRRTGLSDMDYIEDNVELTPIALSHYAKVVVELVNPASAAVANGALRGFAGSVFMASGMPSHLEGTHQVKLNNLTMIELTVGTVESPTFATFGPPLDLTEERRYTFELQVILIDGEPFAATVDVTEQVQAAIVQIKDNRANGIYHPANILIKTRVELPKVTSSQIGVTPWNDDELITIKV